MEKHEKPAFEVILLGRDVITTSCDDDSVDSCGEWTECQKETA